MRHFANATASVRDEEGNGMKEYTHTLLHCSRRSFFSAAPIRSCNRQPPMHVNDLCLHSAQEMAALLQARAVSAVELLDAHLKQIAAFNPTLNAIPTLDADAARVAAKSIDARRMR